MKYEAVFGDQRLFKDCSENAILVTSDLIPTAPTVEFFSDDKLNFETVDVDSRRIKVAMRRIIAEPNRWTLEDKKAGRLPEVGSLVAVAEIETKNNIFEFAGVCAGSKRFAVKDITDGFLYFYSKEMIAPIETPEEKAQRLRDEWRIKALSSASILSGMQEYELKRLGGYIGDIYDALLSGELTMPSKDGE